MQTVAVAEVLAGEGLGPPGLNVLVPNEQNYTALLMQPQGDIEISGAGVRNRDQASAAAQFGAFLRDARETDADLTDGAVTPQRQQALAKIAKEAGFPERRVVFVTAFLDRSHATFKKSVAELAWNGFVWFAAEPEHIMFLKEGSEGKTAKIWELITQ